jgi:hypothetical protein
LDKDDNPSLSEKTGGGAASPSLTIQMHPSFHMPMTLIFTPSAGRTLVKCEDFSESWDLSLPGAAYSERFDAFRRVLAAERPQVLVLDGMRVNVRFYGPTHTLKLDGENVGGYPALAEFIASTLRLLLAADAPEDLQDVLYGVGIYVGVKPS